MSVAVCITTERSVRVATMEKFTRIFNHVEDLVAAGLHLPVRPMFVTGHKVVTGTEKELVVDIRVVREREGPPDQDIGNIAVLIAHATPLAESILVEFLQEELNLQAEEISLKLGIYNRA